MRHSLSSDMQKQPLSTVEQSYDLKWAKKPIPLYKVIRPDWTTATEYMSFEVQNLRHNYTYAPGQKTTVIQPAFFFLSRARAVNYLTTWFVQDFDFARDAQIWRCEAESIYPAPSYVPSPESPDLFDTFWEQYYQSTDRDVRYLFQGLQPTPVGTVLAFTFSIERRVNIPSSLYTIGVFDDE